MTENGSTLPARADQSAAAYRFEWGLEGLEAIAPSCDVVVIVDVLRFTTAVSAAVEAGATVVPATWDGDRARELADQWNAVVAGSREDGPSLSPTDLLRLAPGTRLVLPSPNGSTLAARAGELGVPFVLAGSLRNATATARRALMLAHDGPIGVVAAGERWRSPAGPLRPAIEDLLGAGAILHGLDPAAAVRPPHASPEARAARAAFLDARATLHDALQASTSGRELVARGWDDDVATAAHLDATDLAAQSIDGEFVAV